MKYHAVYSGSAKVFEEQDGKVLLDIRDQVKRDAGYYVMGDIKPYISQLTGKEVSSRSEHRALLREHKCVEVGNETKYLKPKPIAPPPGLKQTIIEVAKSKRYL